MTEQNKYGGYAEDPYDAAKAKEAADKKNHQAHFVPISWALAAIKKRAEGGNYTAFLMDRPWCVEDSYGDEMRMHLRDRRFKVEFVPNSDDQMAHTKVQW